MPKSAKRFSDNIMLQTIRIARKQRKEKAPAFAGASPFAPGKLAN
jgi:hypothetical protein